MRSGQQTDQYSGPMKSTVAFTARLFDALWTLFMGLFLGLTLGLVLAVILTFRGAKAVSATPGTFPFSDPRFTAHHSDAVAGYIGQNLFMVGGSVALVFLGLSLVARIGNGLFMMMKHRSTTGSNKMSQLRWVALLFCTLCMVKAASLTRDMNAAWPGLYDIKATDAQIQSRRDAFENMHKLSEKIVMAAWLGGLGALLVSPWCRHLADNGQLSDPSLSKK